MATERIPAEFNVLTIIGKSGSGKSFWRDYICKESENKDWFHKVITWTTRKPRPGERNGVDYWFVTRESFWEEVDKGYMIEWAKYDGEFYGTSVAGFVRGKINVVVQDPQGAKKLAENPRFKALIMWCTCDKETRIERCKKRGDSLDSIFNRIAMEDYNFSTGYLSYILADCLYFSLPNSGTYTETDNYSLVKTIVKDTFFNGEDPQTVEKSSKKPKKYIRQSHKHY